MTIAIIILSCIGILSTLGSLIKWDHWWARIHDFPRVQVSFLLLLMIITSVIYYDFQETWQIAFLILLVVSLAYQLFRIYPYTILAKKQVLRYHGKESDDSISMVVSNVLTPNKKVEKLINHVRNYKPDILLTLESDKRWENELAVLEDEYQYTVKVPQDNLYGMHLYSKLELSETSVNFLIQDDIPSIESCLKLRSGKIIRIHCLHPMPPSPTESETSTNRDAELLVVGKKIDKSDSVLVFGDLNDVAWSGTTTLFQKISRLLDPRKGRGLFSTYHAGYPIFRWPLDHIFHSDDFKLIKIMRLKSIGSDHFPIYVSLHFDDKAQKHQDRPKANGDEKEEATDKIKEAKENES